MQRILRRLGPSAQEAPAHDAVPAGQEPNDTTASSDPGFRERGRLRRHLRYLRRARELGYRDLGGLVYDMRRFERDRPDLVEAKVEALGALDRELRALEVVLDDRRAIHELREPGIASCARCGALHSSEANFCPNCGLSLDGPPAMGELGGSLAAPPQAPADIGSGEPPHAAGYGPGPADRQATQSFGPTGEQPPRP